ncbi:MAG: NAD(P)-dependent oxidoreductase, partial [Caulobacterales bacterium]|nr:NAD(P)-dependent oxidoreductase [Caulobacterales bacterium]
MPETVGFVGVGRMGANMARRLKDCKHKVVAVHDVNRSAARAVAKEVGAKACDTLAEVTATADVIITVVTDDKAMRAVYGGKKDNLLIGAKGRLFVNCATISPAVHVEVEAACRKAKAECVEACMASSIPQARQGTLYLMVAGREKSFKRAEKMLKKMSSSLRYVGKAGQAANVKALVNMVMNINTAGLAEGLGLGQALGLDLNMLKEVFSQTGANSRVLETDADDMIARDHDCYFSSAHAAKDSGIALALGKKRGLNLPLAAATKRQFDRLTKDGKGELDKSAVAELTFKGRHKVRKAKRKK